GTDGLGVPDHLYRVPDRLSAQTPEDGWRSGAVEHDPAVGTAAAAWLTPAGGLPVVVGAADGDYHLLDLPGYAGNNWWMHVTLHEPTIALSPDGSRLAYSWAEFGPDSDNEPIPSGIRVVDLRTGETSTYALEGAEGTVVTEIAWSPGARWLGWAGARMASWTEMSMGGSDGVAGRIELASDARTELDIGSPEVSIGIDDRGVLAVGSGSRLRLWDGRHTDRARVTGLTDLPIAAGPGGAWAVPGTEVVTLLEGDDVRDIPVDGATRVFALGATAGDLVVSTDRNDGTGTTYLVASDGGAPRPIIDVGIASPGSLTLAVDLIDPDHPTVERPAPHWPWWTDRGTTILWGSAVALLVLVAAGSLVLSRRRSSR
ncbi:hypothetical protein, partial [Nocardioides sp.]|uniref:hypothetical protein n=1 Tax=Nocardioides sp. TaxID=35761 RepID=UPI0025EE2812